MAHFAELDENNIVLRVIVVDNNDILDNLGVEQEQMGVDLCTNLLGGTWIQTSYNDNMRKQYAGIGYDYDSTKDKFISPQPFPSWSLDTNDDWEAPVAYPTDGRSYMWDETTESWVEN